MIKVSRRPWSFSHDLPGWPFLRPWNPKKRSCTVETSSRGAEVDDDKTPSNNTATNPGKWERTDRCWKRCERLHRPELTVWRIFRSLIYKIQSSSVRGPSGPAVVVRYWPSSSSLEDEHRDTEMVDRKKNFPSEFSHTVRFTTTARSPSGRFSSP